MQRTWITLVVLPVLTAAFGAGAVKPGPRQLCLRTKRRAAGGAARRALACHAQAARRGADVDARCLDKAASRLRKAFDKADRKAARRGGCPDTGDADTIWGAVATFGDDVTAAIGAGDARSKCDAKKLKAVAGAARRLLVAKAKTKPPLGTEPLSRTIAKVNRKLAKAFAAAERRDDCGTGEDAVDVAARIAQLAGVGGMLRGRILGVKRIRMPEASQASVLANRAAFEAEGLSVADDGSWVEGPVVPAPGWLVTFGDATARTNLDGEFTIDVPAGAPLVGSLFHPSSDTFEVGPIALAQLAGGADEPEPVFVSIESEGSCSMNANPAENPTECHGAVAARRRVSSSAGDEEPTLHVNPDPVLYPPLVEKDGTTYPNMDPAATQIVCLDYDGYVPLDAVGVRHPVGFPGSLCWDRVVMGCCDNERASVRILDPLLRHVPGLDPKDFPGPTSCQQNHGGGRFCQQLQQGDVAVGVGAATIGAGSSGFIEVTSGEKLPVVVHNNGCYGRTHVTRLPSPVPLGGVLLGNLFDGMTLSHIDGGVYYPDRGLNYQTPDGCPDSTPHASDVFQFETDGAAAVVTFSCVPTTTTTSTSTSMMTTTTSTTATSTTLPSCHFDATIGGVVVAAFDGPAEAEFGSDGSLQIRLRTSTRSTVVPDGVIQGGVETAPSTPRTPGTYEVVAGGATVAFTGAPPMFFQYIQGAEGFDCPGCGGILSIDSIEPTGIEGYSRFTGSLAVTAPDPYAPPDAPASITLEASFVADEGSTLDPSSAYIQCLAAWGPE